ncbi:TonB-dependent receptor [Solimonas variicoloris]|uniref:TonB-dependent receptor n=1 Tax=Solimonas variicoloris TaxID=254408 RepID=UPI000367AB9E|nr:TonB-dependent receptor [Solimonas variicoloris]
MSRFIRLALSAVLGSSAPVLAQSAAPPDVAAEAGPAPAAAGAAADSAVHVEEIVVTARKREERLQDVPVAATVLGAGSLEDRGIDNIKELVQLVPNATTADLGASHSDEIIMRGQGTGRHINADTATGLYRNGIFIAGGNTGGRNFSDMDMFDVERVEVLRGPQGALYGQNAVGGAINVISRRPLAELGAALNATYGNKDYLLNTGIVNVPVSSDFGVRAGYRFVDRSDGFFTNTRDGKALDQENFLGGRVAAQWRPAERLNLVLTNDYYKDDGPSYAVGTFNPLAHENPYHSYQDDTSRYDRHELSSILEVEYELGFAQLSAVTLLRKRSATTRDDLDAFFNLPITGFTRVSDEDYRRIGQEVRLASTGTQRLTWLLGGSYAKTDGTFEVITNNSNLSRTETDNWSAAVFGSLGYDLTSQLNATAELRYTREHKAQDLLSRLTAVSLPVSQSDDVSFNKLSPVATLSYRPNEALNLYARYATAYRAGGFNSVPDDNAPAAPRFDLPYDSETISSYELGAKTSFLDRRVVLNLAAFRSLTNDLLIVNQAPSATAPGTNLNYLSNAGDATQWGIELDGSAAFRVGGGRLSLDLSGSWAHSEIDSNGPYDGTEVPYVYHWKTAASATYRRPFGTRGTIGFLHYGFRGAWGGYQDEVYKRELDNVLLHDLGLGIEQGRWSLTGTVDNLYNYFYVTQIVTPMVSRASTPRTWKLNLKVDF